MSLFDTLMGISDRYQLYTKKLKFRIKNYYIAAAASGPNMEILQYDWFLSCRIFPVLPAQGGDI